MELHVTRNGETYLVRWISERFCNSIRVYTLKPSGLFRKRLLVTYLEPILEASYAQKHPNADQDDDYLVHLGEFAVDCCIHDQQKQQETDFRLCRQRAYLSKTNEVRRPGPSPDISVEIADLSDEDLLRKAHEQYKLFWMMTHNKTIRHLADYLFDHIRDTLQAEDGNIESLDIGSALWDWEIDAGFGGEIWPCLDEFRDAEYQDREIMSVLLTPAELALWDRRVGV